MKKIMLLASALAMVMVAAAPAMAQDNSVNDSFNVSDSGNTTTTTTTQTQTQSSTVGVTQVNSAVSGDATNVGDTSVVSSEASVYSPVFVYQSALQFGGGFYWFY